MPFLFFVPVFRKKVPLLLYRRAYRPEQGVSLYQRITNVSALIRKFIYPVRCGLFLKRNMPGNFADQKVGILKAVPGSGLPAAADLNRWNNFALLSGLKASIL